MKISGGIFYFTLYLVLFLSFNCIGVENHSNPLKVAMEIQKAQYILDRYPDVPAPALINPDGTPLHDQVNSIYEISQKDGEDIVSLKESSENLKIFEKKNLEKTVTNFPNLFYAPKLTSKEVIEDAEDIDLGLPPKNRTLNAEEKKKRVEEEIFQLKKFHTEVRSFIYDASPVELKNMRTNFTIAIGVFAELEDLIKANPEIDQEYFKTLVEYIIQSRMLVIDAMSARGVSQ
jgi:hypothetical protein